MWGSPEQLKIDRKAIFTHAAGEIMMKQRLFGLQSGNSEKKPDSTLVVTARPGIWLACDGNAWASGNLFDPPRGSHHRNTQFGLNLS